MNVKIYLFFIVYFLLNCCTSANRKEENKYSHAYVESSFSTEYINSLFENKGDLIDEKDLHLELDCFENKVIDTLYVNQEKIFVSKCIKDKKTVVTYSNKNKIVLLAVSFIHIDMTKIFFLQEDKFNKLITGIINHGKFILNMNVL